MNKISGWKIVFLFHLWILSFFGIAIPNALSSDDSSSTQPLSRNMELLNLITGNTDQKDYVPRANAVLLLNDYLTEEEIASVKEFLYQKKLDLSNMQINSIKNDLVIVLMRQKKPVQDLALWLMEMFSDPEYGDTWRDYCMQFLGQIYPDTSEQVREKIRGVFQKGMKERANGIAGAAMIAVNRNINDPLIDRKALARTACEVAVSEDSPDYLKITAVQIAALNGEKDILNFCEEVLTSKNAKYSVQLKMSAMSAIGILGDSEKLPLLRRYAGMSDIRL